MPLAAVTAATCISAAFGSFMMGILARYPIALAPGMGLNAYFTYTVVKGMGIPWQAALGAVFVSGVAFLILTAVGIRQLIVAAIPFELYAAVAAGVGLFIAFIGFHNAGLIVPHPATLVTLGNVRDPHTLLAVFGLLATSALLARRVPAAMLIGILLTTIVGIATGLVAWNPQPYSFLDLSATMLKLDVGATLRLGFFEIVFVFLFIDMFDNIGTLVAVGKRGPIQPRPHDPARGSHPVCRRFRYNCRLAHRYLDSGELYRERRGSGCRRPQWRDGHGHRRYVYRGPVRRAGGGRDSSGRHRAGLDRSGQPDDDRDRRSGLEDPEVAIPGFLTMLAIPLTFSIANGLAFGFIAYTALKVARGKFRDVNWLVYVLTLLFIARFAYLKGA